MALQTAWLGNILTRREGMPVDFNSIENGDRVTRRNGSTTAIEPGLIVVQDTDAAEVRPPSAIADTAVGLAVDTTIRERTQGATTTAGWEENDLLSVARTGRWYAISETAATIDQQVHVRAVAGSGETAGHIRNAADSTDTFTINAKFAETITAAGVVAIELNMPQV